MRFRHPDGTVVHLSYGTNVHPAEDLAGVLGQLGTYAEPVREQLGAARLGLGLWLARDVTDALLADPAALAGLRSELDSRGLEVVTLNGFPYRGFHEPVVKGAVYLPDWTSPHRLEHTLDLARVLVALLPEDVQRGSISTLPLGWRTPWGQPQREASARALDALAEGLSLLEHETGRAVRVGFEPEPGCVVETSTEAAQHLAGADGERLGVCLDACHLAVAFEQPEQALERFQDAALPVVKTQASAALHVSFPDDPAARAALDAFAEPRFLHQTREAAADGVRARDDLPQALHGSERLPGEGPWRVHFHVPLHARLDPPLGTTRDVLDDVLAGLLGGPAARTDCVEVETYTWDVLPPERRPQDAAGLVTGIAAEVDSARQVLLSLGLQEVAW